MVKLIGGRAAAAVMGLFMLAIGSSAAAQDLTPQSIHQAVQSLDVNNGAKTLGAVAAPAANMVQNAVATTTAVVASNGTIAQAQPARSVTVQLAPSIAREAAWLYKAGWPLYALVDKFATNAPLDEQTNCLATAVYFESCGESL